jgi:NADH:ubiquinone oxidoreductase subunit F (NADH-binding)
MTATQVDTGSHGSLIGHAMPDPYATDRLLPHGRSPSLADHLARLGPMPRTRPAQLAGLLEAAGLLGRGGAGFPTGRKVSAVAAAAIRKRLPPVVVANCCEGDPTSLKDRVLVERSPHLVIDGALHAAEALGADRVVLAVHDDSPTRVALAAALAERPQPSCEVSVVEVPDRYIASEATALVRYLNSGDARPAGKLIPIWETGVGGRPTLVDNAETLAQLALIARFGRAWFGAVGSAAEPGTSLVTIGGAVQRPGVVEVAHGTPLATVLGRAGAASTGWALLGGLAGRWVDLSAIAGVGFSTAELSAVGGARGVGSIIVLPPGGCVLGETARILRYHADAGARQCGPCMFGLPAIAADMAALGAGDRGALDRLRRRLPVINGRGGCGHPDGAVALAASALTVLTAGDAGHLHQHLTGGRCQAPPVVVPLGAVPSAPRPSAPRPSAPRPSAPRSARQSRSAFTDTRGRRS